MKSKSAKGPESCKTGPEQLTVQNLTTLCVHCAQPSNSVQDDSFITITVYDAQTYIACLHDQSKSGLFWRAGFYLANQNNLKSFHKALIG